MSPYIPAKRAIAVRFMMRVIRAYVLRPSRCLQLGIVGASRETTSVPGAGSLGRVPYYDVDTNAPGSGATGAAGSPAGRLHSGRPVDPERAGGMRGVPITKATKPIGPFSRREWRCCGLGLQSLFLVAFGSFLVSDLVRRTDLLWFIAVLFRSRR